MFEIHSEDELGPGWPTLGPNISDFERELWANRTVPVGFRPRYGWWHIYVTAIILGLLILCTIIGNIFVVAAIVLERNLQSVSNYLILSLAVADLMVATLVMPISALLEVSDRWWLGMLLCDIWVCFDVLCCTASILHLVAIAIDRYWAVTNIDYIRQRTAKRIMSMIVVVWSVSILISVPARFYIGREKIEYKLVMLVGDCRIHTGYAYTIFSTVGAFYLPMAFIMVIYIRIYRTARMRIRRKTFTKHRSMTQSSLREEGESADSVDLGLKQPLPPPPPPRRLRTTLPSTSTPQLPSTEGTANSNSPGISSTSSTPTRRRKIGMAFFRTSQSSDEPPRTPTLPTIGEYSPTSGIASPCTSPLSTGGNGAPISGFTRHSESTTCFTSLSDYSCTGSGQPVAHKPPTSPTESTITSSSKRSFRDFANGSLIFRTKTSTSSYKERLEQKRERKAARTLSIITGCFILCWLPFFINALVSPFSNRSVNDVSPELGSVCTWLGYFNSLLNPIIYTIFAPEFRNAFRKILFGRYHRRKLRRQV